MTIPQYSPWNNPIERYFRYLKAVLARTPTIENGSGRSMRTIVEDLMRNSSSRMLKSIVTAEVKEFLCSEYVCPSDDEEESKDSSENR